MSSKRSLDENTTVDEENKENVETTPVKRSKSDSQENSINRLEKQLFKNETFNAAANETSNQTNDNQTNETINYESGRNESAVETSMEEKSKNETSMIVDENNNLDLNETKKSQLKDNEVKNEEISCSSSNSSLVDLSNASFEVEESQTQNKPSQVRCSLESTRVKLEDNVNQTIAQENEGEQEKTTETEAKLEPKPEAVAEPIKIRKKRTIDVSNVSKVNEINLVKSFRKIHDIKTKFVDGEAVDMPKIVGLEVTKFGLVNFPLLFSDAKKLVKVATPLRTTTSSELFRPGRITVNTFTLDPAKINIKNPEWNSKLNELVKKIAQGLGCLDDIEAKLDQILICQKGSTFLKQRYQNEEKSVMGKLIIQPPSMHTGGDLVVYDSNGEAQKVIDLGQNDGKSQFSVHFAAFCSDLEYEIRQIEDGYRLLFVYTLNWVEDIGNFLTTASIAEEVVPLCESLFSAEKDLKFLLENNYKTVAFAEEGFDALIGKDKNFFETLANLNDQLPDGKKLAFYIFDCQMTIKNQSNSLCYDEIIEWDCDRRSFKTSGIFDQNGNLVLKEFSIDFPRVWSLRADSKLETIQIQSDHAQWGEPTSETIEPFETSYLERVREYHKHILVVWPKLFELDILIKSNELLALAELQHRFVTLKTPFNQNVMRQFKYIMGKFSSSMVMGFPSEPSSTLPKLFNLLKLFDNLELVEMFARRNLCTQAENPMNAWVLAKLVTNFGYDRMKPIVNFILKSYKMNLVFNCQFLLYLVEFKLDQVALDLLKNLVLEVIKKCNRDDWSQLKKEYDYVCEDEKTENQSEQDEAQDVFLDWEIQLEKRLGLITLLRCLVLFSDQSHEAFKVFTQAYTKVQENRLDELIECLSEEDLTFCNSSQVQSFIKSRKKWLREKTESKPAFTWAMPNASLPDYPQVEKFLKSSDEHDDIYFQYSASVDHCISLVESIPNTLNRGFSASFSKAKSKVLRVKKNKKLHERIKEEFVDYLIELDVINEFFLELYEVANL